MHDSEHHDDDDESIFPGDSTYDIEPARQSEPAGGFSPVRPVIRSSDRRCQHCGHPMPADESIMVCSACRYDIVTNRILDPASEVSSPLEPDESEQSDPGPGSSGVPLIAGTGWRPFAIVAGVMLATVAFAMIAGWSSFFPQRDGYFLDAEGRAVLDAPAPLARFGAVLRLLIGSMVIIGCGAGAVRATAWFDSRGFGDPRAVLSRLAFAVSAAAAVRLVPVESHVLRNLVHGGLGIVLIAIVSMWILRDRGRLLGTMLACWALIFLLVVPVARLIAWSIPIF